MEWIVDKRRVVAGTCLAIAAGRIGEDILLCVEGGERPHVGCIIQSQPRLSLTGSGEMRATSSVLNLPGHKDELLCRDIAERVCAATGRMVICTGGFHLDHIRQEQVEEVLSCARTLTEELVQELYINPIISAN